MQGLQHRAAVCQIAGWQMRVAGTRMVHSWAECTGGRQHQRSAFEQRAVTAALAFCTCLYSFKLPRP